MPACISQLRYFLFWAQIVKSKNLGVVILCQTNGSSGPEFCLGHIAESDAFQRDAESPPHMESLSFHLLLGGTWFNPGA